MMPSLVGCRGLLVGMSPCFAGQWDVTVLEIQAGPMVPVAELIFHYIHDGAGLNKMPQLGVLPGGVRLLPSAVSAAPLLTAGGERRRHTFALSSINPGPGLANPNPNYHEEEMAGAVHSDVGGFYGKNRGLANQSLIRMWWDGLNHEVPFGQIPSMYLNIAPNGPNDSRWFNDKAVEALTGKQRVRRIYYHP